MKYGWLFIVPIFALIGILVYALARHFIGRHTAKKSVMVAHSKKIKALTEYENVRRTYRILLIATTVCFLVALFAMTFTASRPVSITESDADYDTRDIMLCLDVSGSMANFEKDAVEFFKKEIYTLKGQRIGIGIFADETAIIAPLTNDYDALYEVLTDVNNGAYAVGGGSNIGDGIINCINGFDKLEEENRSRSVIVLTDGQENGNRIATMIQAGYYATRYDVTLYGIDNTDISPRNYEEAITLTGGVFYRLKSKNGIDSGEAAAKEIMTQEAMKYYGKIQVVESDSPNLIAIVASVATLLMLVLLWRIKL